MRTESLWRIVLVSAVALACHSQDLTDPSAMGSDQASVLTPHLPVGVADFPVFDPKAFVSVVTNPLFPLPLGRKLIYRGTEDEMPETVVTDITFGHKTILGVPVTVVLDRVFLNGELRKRPRLVRPRHGRKRLVFRRGHQGVRERQSREYCRVFEAGKEGAKAGIIMRAHPKVGQVTPQEFAPGVAEDKGRVIDLNARITVPYGTFTHCLKQEEFTALEPDALENKYYCPGLGIVKELDVSGGTVNTGLTKIMNP